MTSALDGIVVIASTANAGGIRDVEACGELSPVQLSLMGRELECQTAKNCNPC